MWNCTVTVSNFRQCQLLDIVTNSRTIQTEISSGYSFSYEDSIKLAKIHHWFFNFNFAVKDCPIIGTNCPKYGTVTVYRKWKWNNSSKI